MPLAERSYQPTKALGAREMQDKSTPGIDLDQLLTPAEAAQFLRVSVSFLAKARMIGSGPRYVKIGRRVFYRRSDLLDYLNRCSRRSTSARDRSFPS